MALLSDLLNLARGNAGQKLGGAVGVVGNTLRLPELNASERISNFFAPKVQASEGDMSGGNWENPWNNQSDGRNYILENGLLNPLPNKGGGGGGGGGGDTSRVPDNGNDNAAAQRAILEAARERELGRLRDQFNEGMGYFSAARDTLGKRRGQFKQEYEDTATDNFNQYQGGRGNLQAASQGADARTTRGLLARGVAGSALDEALRMNQAGRMGSLNEVVQNRASNDRANTRALNERNTWADSQEGEINRGEQSLQSAYRRGTETTIDNFQNTLASLLSEAQAQRSALQAALGRVANTELAGPDVTGLDTESILGGLNTALQSSGLLGMNTGGGVDANINPRLEGLSLSEQEKRRRGLLQAPVYA